MKPINIFAVMLLCFYACKKDITLLAPVPPLTDYRQKFEGNYAGIDNCTSWDIINGITSSSNSRIVIVKIDWATNNQIIIDNIKIPVDTSGEYSYSAGPPNQQNYSVKFIKDTLFRNNGYSSLGGGNQCSFKGEK